MTDVIIKLCINDIQKQCGIKVIRRYKVEKCINRLKQAQQHVEKFKWNEQAGRFSSVHVKKNPVFVLQQNKAQKCEICVIHGLSVLDSRPLIIQTSTSY